MMCPRSILLAASILLGGNGALAFTGTSHPTQINNACSSELRPCILSSTTAIMASPSDGDSRRNFLNELFSKAAAASMLVGFTSTANALDFDAFEKGEVDKDTKQCDPKLDRKCIPKLTPDEALCKYGVSGADARTAACRRVRDAGGALPSSKPGERSTMGWLNGDIAL